MKDNVSKKSYLLKNTFALALGNFGSKLIVFFLVPLYTNVLTTKEYGTIDLITIISTVLVPIITLNIQEAIMRFMMDKENESNKVLTTGLIMTLVTLLFSILFIPIYKYVPVTSNYSILLSLYMFTFSVSSMCQCYLRGKEKLFEYSIISIIQTLIIAVLNIYFLLVLNAGIRGYIVAYIIAYCMIIILCIIYGKIFKSFKFDIDKNLQKKMIKYSIFLIPNSLMWWIMNSLDHVMVTSMINLEANGIYAVSYKIPTIIMTLTTIFNQAWMFSAVKEKESLEKNVYTNEIYSVLFNIVVTISLGILLILKPLLTIYVGVSFYSSWMFTPPLIIGSMFLTLATFLSNEYTANKDSIGFLKSSSIGAVCNLLLNFLLIPKFGVFGAAIATCISYISVFVFRCFDTKKYLKIQILNKEKIFAIILLILSSLSIYIENDISNIILCCNLLLYIIVNYKFWIRIVKGCVSIVIKKKKVNQ